MKARLLIGSLLTLLFGLLLLVQGCATMQSIVSPTIPLTDRQNIPEGVAGGDFKKYREILNNYKKRTDSGGTIPQFIVFRELGIMPDTSNKGLRWVKTGEDKAKIRFGGPAQPKSAKEARDISAILDRINILQIIWDDYDVDAQIVTYKLKADVFTTGPNTADYLIFEQNADTNSWELVKVTAPDPETDTRDGKYVTSFIGGAASNASGEGGKQIIRTVR